MAKTLGMDSLGPPSGSKEGFWDLLCKSGIWCTSLSSFFLLQSRQHNCSWRSSGRPSLRHQRSLSLILKQWPPCQRPCLRRFMCLLGEVEWFHPSSLCARCPTRSEGQQHVLLFRGRRLLRGWHRRPPQTSSQLCSGDPSSAAISWPAIRRGTDFHSLASALHPPPSP